MGQNIKYILIGEAPHFGEEESYIYNPEFDRTPFLEFTHIESIAQSVGIGGVVRNKSDMLKMMIRLGLLVVDYFPYPLSQNTSFNLQQHQRKAFLVSSKCFFMELEAKVGMHSKKIKRESCHWNSI